ncbi:hypothetical protein Q4S25_16575, partial [Morganella morganii]
WETRKPTQKESIAHYEKHGNFFAPNVRVNLLKTIPNPYVAAIHQILHGATYIENHIDNFLDNSADFKKWLSCMPEVVPQNIRDYQQIYNENCIYEDVSQTIRDVGAVLPDGQYIFHGGALNFDKNRLITTRPLSTTLCPQVAIREAEHKFKAYHSGKIEITVIKLKSTTTKAFVFDPNLADGGNEKEVLFSSGATLTLTHRFPVTKYYSTIDPDQRKINLPSFIVMAELS